MLVGVDLIDGGPHLMETGPNESSMVWKRGQ